MGLTILQTTDPELVRVQQNVKKELDALAAAIPNVKAAASTHVITDYTVRLTDRLVLVNSPITVNITLPHVSTCIGQQFSIKNISTAALVNIRGQYVSGAFQTIDSQAPYVVPAETCLTCYSDGFKWWVI